MNKVILAMAICLGLTACGGNGTKKDNAVKVEQS